MPRGNYSGYLPQVLKKIRDDLKNMKEPIKLLDWAKANKGFLHNLGYTDFKNVQGSVKAYFVDGKTFKGIRLSSTNFLLPPGWKG